MSGSLYFLISLYFFFLPVKNKAPDSSRAKRERSVSIVFSNTVNQKEINFDSVYTNSFSESFKIRSLKYYISDITLIDRLNSLEEAHKNKYFLINESDESSLSITLHTGLKRIDAISFLIGVDSIKNVSGVQTGTLDPANGMFWTWNTGYTFFKFEGNAPIAKTPGRAFSYHVGGYKKGENALRKIELKVNDSETKNSSFTINASIENMFDAVHTIKIENTPLCHEPGDLAMKLADNYSRIFSLQSPSK